MLYEFTDRYGQSWAIEMPEGGVGVLRSPLNPEQPLTAADALGSEVLRLVGRVAALEQENATLRADNLSLVNDLEKEGHRLTSLRLEVETLKLENRRLLAKRAEDDYHWKGEVRSRQTEIQSLRIDLAAAIKTGEEQDYELGKIRNVAIAMGSLLLDAPETLNTASLIEACDHAAGARLRSLELQAHVLTTLLKPIQEHHQEGESALDTLVRCLREREEARRAVNALEDCRRGWLAWGNEAQERLSRLDALLSSEEAPEGFADACNNAFAECVHRITTEAPATAAWRWFRDILRGPIDDPAPEKEPDPEAVMGAWERFRELAGPPSVEAIGAEIARAQAKCVKATHPGRWISPEEAKDHWPDSSEPIRTQPVMESALRTEPTESELRDILSRSQAGPAPGTLGAHIAGMLDDSVEPGVVVAAAPGSLAAEYVKENGPQPWFAGLSMEEVYFKIQTGEAPGSREPEAVIQVPRGYLDWMVRGRSARPMPADGECIYANGGRIIREMNIEDALGWESDMRHLYRDEGGADRLMAVINEARHQVASEKPQGE